VNAAPVVLAYGAGTNSTGMLAGMLERGQRPDLILFGNTGGERPEIYRHIEIVNDWCISVGFPPIVTVKKGGTDETLEQVCLRLQCLPSIAYGFKTCSQRFKGEPQNVYVNHWAPARLAWEAGLKVTKLIGYDADEPQRAKPYSDSKYDVRYPLIEWDWGRDECIAAIKRAGLPQPGKSACFFCPSSKKAEILDLQRDNPDLYERAVAMEINNKTDVVGLGRKFAWSGLRGMDRLTAGIGKTESLIEIDCGCYDGD
jgi:hypothetical protein